jgi:hypothetical protein
VIDSVLILAGAGWLFVLRARQGTSVATATSEA